MEAPQGGDFRLPLQNIASIREMMPGRYKFIIGLANDEIGYIIPKSQWDTKKPYAYNMDKPQYGEDNSLGPETAPLLFMHIKDLLGKTGK